MGKKILFFRVKTADKDEETRVMSPQEYTDMVDSLKLAGCDVTARVNTPYSHKVHEPNGGDAMYLDLVDIHGRHVQ